MEGGGNRRERWLSLLTVEWRLSNILKLFLPSGDSLSVGVQAGSGVHNGVVGIPGSFLF